MSSADPASSEAPSSSRAIAPYIGWNLPGPSTSSFDGSGYATEVPRIRPLSYYHLLMMDGFPTSSSSSDFIFGDRRLDPVRHGESHLHDSPSREGQSFHYPRSYAS